MQFSLQQLILVSPALCNFSFSSFRSHCHIKDSHKGLTQDHATAMQHLCSICFNEHLAFAASLESFGNMKCKVVFSATSFIFNLTRFFPNFYGYCVFSNSVHPDLSYAALWKHNLYNLQPIHSNESIYKAIRFIRTHKSTSIW